MPESRHASLLLPSPLGLLEYDVLEDTVFLGPGPKGRLAASASPFPEATVILNRSGDGFVARAMPGEAAPQVNGEEAASSPLADGDRLGVAGKIVLFRTSQGARTAPAVADTPPSKPASRPATAPRREAPPRPRGSGVRAGLALLGAILVLGAAWRAMGHIQLMQGEERDRTDMPAVPVPMVMESSKAARDLEQVHSYERSHPTAWSRLAERYTAFLRRHPSAREAEAAEDRLRELMESWALQERDALEATLERQLGGSQFSRALESIRGFEKRFASTRAGQTTEALRRRVRTEAGERIDALLKVASGLVDRDPYRAARMLSQTAHQYPPDMAARLVDMIEHARRKMDAGVRPPPRERPERERPPAPREGDSERPRPPAPLPEGPVDGEEVPTDPAAAEEAAIRLWRDARDALRQGRYTDARGAYEVLLKRYADTKAVGENTMYLLAGLRAAKVGEEGPTALCSVPATMKRGRITVEYTFNDATSWQDDFTHEKPFASDRNTDVELIQGRVAMTGCSGLIHNLVFVADDVRVEARVTADVAHDFGICALEEGDAYRALLFSVNNTKFKLKKGDAAKVNPGHLIWYVGEGVWADADKDVHGFIKIAERANSKLEDGDEVRLEFERRKNNVCEAGFGASSDGVGLKGNVVGDNGSTMGSARVGVWVHTGRIRVRQVTITGKVDMAWFAEHVKIMAAGDPGPR